MSRTRHRPRLGGTRDLLAGPRAPLAAVGVGVLLLGGCAGESQAGDLEPVMAASVVGTDQLVFEPAEFAVPAGEAIELVLHAEAGAEHDLVVEGAGELGGAFPQDGEHDDDHDHDGDDLTTDDLHVAHADAGARARSLFTIREPGTYEVYCSVPGHREAGMTGTLVVVE